MTETPHSRYLRLGAHEMHVTEWGHPEQPPLVLWHGLARTGRDFDELARGLSHRWHVLCPDTIGRGMSSWSRDPDTDYTIATYAAHALAMLDAYGIGRCAWLGTSMGGLIGMDIASGPAAERLSALIVNDIGPELPQAAVDRIVAYAGTLPDFAGMAEAEAWLRQVYAPFGPAEDSFWQRMAECSVRRRDNGVLTLHYDPAIVRQFEVHPEDFSTWERYETIATPTQLIWGRQSDLLTEEIISRMQASGPRPKVTVYDSCGHAPSLVSAAAIADVSETLDRLSGRTD
ncbi:alpha/beta fold hydrolase [Acidimangrovimonas pyrenivorans]|uniref:Alpha/beta fold hydrolase n=1 Tax=Acidimangrovimonas pyrenivorans TaxID=2030798 RepID=A0ABV7AK85_9RHOB